MAGGRKRKDTPTQHGWRMHYLVLELIQELGSQAEVARRTGLDAQYINAFRNIETSGVKGVSADIIGTLLEQVGIDPMFFFDTWKPGEKKSYRLYSLENRRNARETQGLATEVKRLRAELDELRQLVTSGRQSAAQGPQIASAGPPRKPHRHT